MSNSKSPKYIWVLEHGRSPYWSKVYSTFNQYHKVIYMRLNPLSFIRIIFGNNIINSNLYIWYQNKRGYVNRKYIHKKYQITKLDIQYIVIYILFLPYFISISIHSWILLLKHLLPKWLAKEKVKNYEKNLYNSINDGKIRLTDCILTQYLRSYYSSGSISDFSIRTLVGLFFSSFIVLSRFNSIKLIFLIFKYHPPKYYIINEFGYSDEAIRRLFISFGSSEITRPKGFKKFLVTKNKLNTLKKLEHPGVNSFIQFRDYSCLYKDSFSEKFLTNFIERKHNYQYMNSNLVWENNPLLYKEFDNLIKNENSNGKKKFVFLHLHRVSDVQFWCGYNNNFIDLADWTSSCIENLTSKNIIVFAKFHPNVYNPTPKGEINYPVDHRYCNSLINKYGFSRLNRKNTFEKSNYLPNLYQIYPNLDTLKLILELKENNFNNENYFCTLSHHGTICLESTVVGINSYASEVAKKSGYENACILYKNCDDLIKKILNNEQVPHEYTNKARKLLYTVAKHRDFDHEALSKVTEETFNDIIKC